MHSIYLQCVGWTKNWHLFEKIVENRARKGREIIYQYKLAELYMKFYMIVSLNNEEHSIRSV